MRHQLELGFPIAFPEMDLAGEIVTEIFKKLIPFYQWGNTCTHTIK